MSPKPSLCSKNYPTYEEREAMKAEGWKIYREKGASLTQRRSGIWRVIESHYWRARETLEQGPALDMRKVLAGQHAYFRGIELEIDWYTEHWLAAMGHMIDDAVLDPEVMLYHARANRYMPKGHSYYKVGCIESVENSKDYEPAISCWCADCQTYPKRRAEIRRERRKMGLSNPTYKGYSRY